MLYAFGTMGRKRYPEAIVAHTLAVAEMTGGARTAHRIVPGVPVRTIQSWRAKERRAPQNQDQAIQRRKDVLAEVSRLHTAWKELTYAAISQVSERVESREMADAELVKIAVQGTDRLLGLTRSLQLATSTPSNLSLADRLRRRVVMMMEEESVSDARVETDPDLEDVVEMGPTTSL